MNCTTRGHRAGNISAGNRERLDARSSSGSVACGAPRGKTQSVSDEKDLQLERARPTLEYCAKLRHGAENESGGPHSEEGGENEGVAHRLHLSAVPKPHRYGHQRFSFDALKGTSLPWLLPLTKPTRSSVATARATSLRPCLRCAGRQPAAQTGRLSRRVCCRLHEVRCPFRCSPDARDAVAEGRKPEADLSCSLAVRHSCHVVRKGLRTDRPAWPATEACKPSGDASREPQRACWRSVRACMEARI